MSDKSTEAASLEDQIAYARQRDPSQQNAAQAADEIDALRLHCKAFIDALALRLGEGRAHQIAMSRSMLEQMIFWLRSARP
jgi:hypothetical protein